MPGLPLLDRLAATRTQLDVLAQALGRVDTAAIEDSARALAHLLGDLPTMAASAGSLPGTALDPDVLDDLGWQVERCRRLGSLAGGSPAIRTPEYQPDGHARARVTDTRPHLKVAG